MESDPHQDAMTPERTGPPASDDQLRDLLNSAPAMLWVTDADGTVSFLSQGWYEFTGQDQYLGLGSGWLSVVHPDDLEDVQREFSAALAAHEPIVIEYRIRRADGTYGWALDAGRPRFDADRVFAGYIGSVIDISARRESEKLAAIARRDARHSEGHLEVLSNTVPALISYVGPDRCYRTCNDEYTKWFGLPRSAIVGRHMRDVLGDAAWQVVGPHVDAAFAGETVEYEVEAPYRHGGTRWIHAVYTPHRADNGTVQGIVVMVTDVTARRVAEEKARLSSESLQNLIELAPFGMYIIDSEFRIAQLNAGSRDGAFRNVRPVIGRDFAEAIRIIWPEPLATDLIGIFRHTLATGEPYFSRDFTSPRGDVDAVESYEWELHRIQLPDGSLGVVCYYYDSTRLRRAELALREADRHKDEFLATLAHELRNPLAPIRNSLHILTLASGDSAATARVHEMLERQVNHMVRLVDDLMEVSRITRSRIELRVEPLDLADVLRSAIETSKPLIDAAGHRLQVSVPPEPLVLEADPMRLAQVVSNLLNNAAKYTNPRGQITLSARRDGPSAVITVRDDGMGIPADMLPKVFDLFTQVDRGYGRAHGGLGVGLTLVRSLVDLHGGTVEARSDGPGHGSEFEVRLPLARGAARGSVREQRGQQATLATQRRILVVDDSRDAADSLAMLLGLLGADVRIAHDGREALDALEAYRPSVMLLDIGMPGMDGFEVARQARKMPEGRDVTMIALSGWGQEQDRRLSREAGIDHHLIKPVDLAALEQLLATLPTRGLSRGVEPLQGSST